MDKNMNKKIIIEKLIDFSQLQSGTELTTDMKIIFLNMAKYLSETDSNEIIEECAKLCEEKWDVLAPNMNYLHKEHIPIEGTQKEMFGFINVLMGIRAQQIRKLKI